MPPVNELAFPGGLSEIEFLDAYEATALRKPQVAADAALKALPFALPNDRASLTAMIVEQFVEAGRRLTAVYTGLEERRRAIARALLDPLPSLDEWHAFAQTAGTIEPETTIRVLAIDESAMPSAELLRAQGDLGPLSDLVFAVTSPAAMVLAPSHERDRVWIVGGDAEGLSAFSIEVSEDEAARLADVTADLSSIARGFLSAYIRTRAGRAPSP